MEDFKLLIGGALEDGDSVMDVINPATEAVLAKAPRASKAQLDKAVAAAKAAFPAWSATPIDERKKALLAMADAIQNNAQVSYRQVQARYQEQAVQSLQNNYIPIGLKDLVKDYFSSLSPGQDGQR